MVNKMITAVLDGLFPHYCELCGARSGVAVPLCPGCQLDLPANVSCCYRCAIPLPATAAVAMRVCGTCLAEPPPFVRVIAPWLYSEQLAQLVQRWKFRGETRLTPLLAALWLQRVDEPEPPDLIVPVPLHWRRLWQRGFNQSALLARELAKATGGVLLVDALRRSKRTPPLGGLGRKARERMLAGSIEVASARKSALAGRDVVLVDDVLTSGATSTACVKVLKRAGAKSVVIACFSRVLDEAIP